MTIKRAHYQPASVRVVADAVRAYIGVGPALTDEERRAVRVILKLHQ